MSKVIGIDLGTTNSCVAVLEGGTPSVIINQEGERTTPSVVAFANGEFLVGGAAKRQAVVNADNTVVSIKRKMGTNQASVLNHKNYLPQEISSMILKTLKKAAEDFIGESVTEAVITVPAYFDDIQRQATKEAGELAGLSVKRIINEPTAAAIAYGLSIHDTQTVMVYDLGGGTFDISIIEFSNDVVEVLATSGNNRLGGDDFDQALTDYLYQEFQKKNHTALDTSPVTMQRVKEAAEKAKKDLSTASSAYVNLPFIQMQDGSPLHLDLQISRATFESLIMDKINSTHKLMELALQDANIFMKEVDKILLVGGSTRIPLVSQKIKEWTGKEPLKNMNPDECVAIGAAVQGENLSNPSSSTALLLLDVTPLSLGVELANGGVKQMIRRNSTIPVSYSDVFTNNDDWQDSIQINVVQGERPMAADNRMIGSLVLEGLRPAPRYQLQVEITFRIDENGIVNVSAQDRHTHRSVSATLRSPSSYEETSSLLKEADDFAEEDRRKEAWIEQKMNAETALQKAKTFLFWADENEDTSAVQDKISMVEDIMRGEMNPEGLKQAIDDLYQAMGASYQMTPSQPQRITDADGFRVNSDEVQNFYNNLT